MTLERVAGVISRNTRASDATARLGGDEFAFILPSTSADQAHFLAERIRHAIESSFSETAVSVTISLGAAEYPVHGRTAEELLDAADKALYESKAHGRNRATLSGAMPEPGNAAAPV
jgi:diguanylate cyclase (GGDEF)-like protein